jgi:hypothetical protein
VVAGVRRVLLCCWPSRGQPRIGPGFLSPLELAGKIRDHLRAYGAACAAFVLLLLAAATGVPLFGQVPCTVDFPHDANPTSIPDEDICNFHMVNSQMYRGGRPDLSAFPKLERLRVRTLISLEESGQAGEERDALARFNNTLKPENCIDFVSFPITQMQISRTGVTDEQVERLFQAWQARALRGRCRRGAGHFGRSLAQWMRIVPACRPQKAAEPEEFSCRGVAQPGSALALGARGPRFKSGRPDQFPLCFQSSVETSFCAKADERGSGKDKLVPPGNP